MATERISMRKTREILRQKWLLGATHRATARSLQTSVGVIGNTLTRAKLAGLKDWTEVAGLTEDELEGLLYRSPAAGSHPREEPDCEWIHRERRRKGVTLQLLHDEYLGQHPSGLRYTMFCERYRRWLSKRGLVMRQEHVAGEKMFVDYSGQKPRVFDSRTGESVEVELFVAVLGASNLAYAEASRSQSSPDWIASHVRAFEYFGGTTRAIVCDQLKSGVVRSCRYEPGVQRTYEELAIHYGTTVVPARPRKPRDKAKVEVCVQIVQRWILARIRHEVFHSLGELNARIRELLVDINEHKVMRRFKRTRRQLFDEIERSALTPLASQRFEYSDWKLAKVNLDYHVVFDEHFYSVPYTHVHEKVWIRATATSVEILLRGVRVASHARSYVKGKYTTHTEHMPSSHRAQAKWTASRILAWAEKSGVATQALCQSILTSRQHPEQGFRSCLGILRLEKRYGGERLEAACVRAMRLGGRNYRTVESILKNGLEHRPFDEELSSSIPIEHENVRGPDYYMN